MSDVLRPFERNMDELPADVPDLPACKCGAAWGALVQNTFPWSPNAVLGIACLCCSGHLSWQRLRPRSLRWDLLSFSGNAENVARSLRQASLSPMTVLPYTKKGRR